MISIFLREEGSIINLEKAIYTRIGSYIELKYTSTYSLTERTVHEYYVEAVFEDNVVQKISPKYEDREDAELFIKSLFGKIKYIEDRHNIFIDASEIDLEVQKRKNTNNSNI
jgi:hypothetical protein